jgi:hypothetical protein
VALWWSHFRLGFTSDKEFVKQNHNSLSVTKWFYLFYSTAIKQRHIAFAHSTRFVDSSSIYWYGVQYQWRQCCRKFYCKRSNAIEWSNLRIWVIKWPDSNNILPKIDQFCHRHCSEAVFWIKIRCENLGIRALTRWSGIEPCKRDKYLSYIALEIFLRYWLRLPSPSKKFFYHSLLVDHVMPMLIVF